MLKKILLNDLCSGIPSLIDGCGKNVLRQSKVMGSHIVKHPHEVIEFSILHLKNRAYFRLFRFLYCFLTPSPLEGTASAHRDARASSNIEWPSRFPNLNQTAVQKTTIKY